MALLDSLKQMFGGNNTGGVMDAAMHLIDSHGGIQGFLQKLQQGGLAQQVTSWTGTGANQSVTGSQITSALGPDMLSQLSSKLGINTSALSGGLANILPNLIDKVTPNGQVDANTHQLMSAGKDKLMSLLSGLK